MNVNIVIHTNFNNKSYSSVVKIPKNFKDKAQAVMRALAKYSQWIPVKKRIININAITNIVICKGKEKKNNE